MKRDIFLAHPVNVSTFHFPHIFFYVDDCDGGDDGDDGDDDDDDGPSSIQPSDCGLTPYNTQIVGGEDADPNEYPWMVALYLGTRPDRRRRFWGGFFFG